eukprot:1161809-Pelagomonas_calceolata.AAC.10
MQGLGLESFAGGWWSCTLRCTYCEEIALAYMLFWAHVQHSCCRGPSWMTVPSATEQENA